MSKTLHHQALARGTEVLSVIHVVTSATAQILSFQAGMTEPNRGQAFVWVMLLKNGKGVLGMPITLARNHAPYQLVSGTLADPALVAGDVLEVRIMALHHEGGALGKGVFCNLSTSAD
jgi:hypothetical protein